MTAAAHATPRVDGVAQSAGELNSILQSILDPSGGVCAPSANAFQHHSRSISSESSDISSLISLCLQDRNIPEGVWKKTAYTAEEICDGNSKWWEFKNPTNPVAYRIRKTSGNIEVSLDVYFKYQGKEENRSRVLERLTSVRKCVESYYGRFGIRLHLGFKVDSGWADWWKSDQAINLHDEFDRAASSEWPMLVHRANEISEETTCTIAAHELGHRLGLPDRYPDESCPSRKIGPYDSLMSSNDVLPLRKLKLYPEDIAIILKPICAGALRHF